MAESLDGRDQADEVQLSVVVPVYACAGCVVALHERLTRSVGRSASCNVPCVQRITCVQRISCV